MQLSEKIQDFPAAPGVYLMKGDDDRILYVGKAKSLRSRIRAYFGPSRDTRYQIQFLMSRVRDIEFIVTDTEKEALILENTLIKKHRPRYNINLRDDKTYFSLRMDMAEEFPRLSIIRRVTRDGARYFGPYSSASAAREVLKKLYRIFPLRHYPLEACRRRGRPCLFYQIKQCSAPCHGLISKEDYAALAEGAALFLEGKSGKVIAFLKEKMMRAAEAEHYEEAAGYRDLIRSVEVTLEKQKVATEGGDSDVLGFHRDGAHLEIALLFIRGGTLIGSRTYGFAWEMDDAEGISSFLSEYYARDVFIPDQVLLPLPLEEAEVFADLLGEKRGKKVSVQTPQRGNKADLVAMACRNAETAAVDRQKAKEVVEGVLAELKEKLHLSRPPRRIECYDISNIQGRFAVGSRVSFLDGKPDKGGYRHYRIRTVPEANDFAMMKEVLSRRFARDEEHPDLIVVDGGQGQLSMLTAVLEELGINDVDAAGLAKSRVEREAEAAEISRSDERVFLPGRRNPVVLRQNSPPLLLLTRIRDEAHRFAITYHQKLRGKQTLTSILDDIPGVGERRRKALLKHFGSLKRIREATAEELAQVPGIPLALAQSIAESMREKHGEDA